jgi:hypothetical protein
VNWGYTKAASVDILKLKVFNFNGFSTFLKPGILKLQRWQRKTSVGNRSGFISRSDAVSSHNVGNHITQVAKPDAYKKVDCGHCRRQRLQSVNLPLPWKSLRSPAVVRPHHWISSVIEIVHHFRSWIRGSTPSRLDCCSRIRRVDGFSTSSPPSSLHPLHPRVSVSSLVTDLKRTSSAHFTLSARRDRAC